MSSLLDQFSTYATNVDDTLVSSVASYGDTSQASVRGAMEDQRLSKCTPTQRWKERIIKEKQSQTGKTLDSLFFNTRLPLGTRLPHVVKFIRMFFDHLLRDGVVHLDLPPRFRTPRVRGIQKEGGTEYPVTSLDTYMTIGVKSFFRYYEENVPEEVRCFERICELKRAILDLGLESIVCETVERNRGFRFNALHVWNEIKRKYVKKTEKPVEVRKVSTSDEGLVSPDVEVGKKILIDFCEEIYRHGRVYIGHKPSGFYLPLAKDVTASITQESMHVYYRAHTTQKPTMGMKDFNRSIIDLGLGGLCRLIKKNGCYFWTLNAKNLLHKFYDDSLPQAPEPVKVPNAPEKPDSSQFLNTTLPHVVNFIRMFFGHLLRDGVVHLDLPPGFYTPYIRNLKHSGHLYSYDMTSLDIYMTISVKSFFRYYDENVPEEFKIFKKPCHFECGILNLGLEAMQHEEIMGQTAFKFNALDVWDEIKRKYVKKTTPEKRPVEVPNAPKKRKVSTTEERMHRIETAVGTLIDRFTEFTEGKKNEAPKVKETVVHTPEKRPVQVPNAPKKKRKIYDEEDDDLEEEETEWDRMTEQQRRQQTQDYLDMNDEWTSRYCGFGPNGLW